jgi:integrase
MARHKRSSALETRAARLRLAVRRKPYFLLIAPRVGLGYRRNQGPGTWVARGADGHGGYWTKAIGLADDHEDADGNSVLTFWQAQDRCKTIVRGGPATGDRPITVAEALQRYKENLQARGGGDANTRRVEYHLPPSLAARPVSLLGSRELRQWRDHMVTGGMKPASADRTASMLRAALNLAARDDARITNAASWRDGLTKLPDAEPPRNMILADDVVRQIVQTAYKINASFGLLVETAAITGARPSQLLRLEVGDLNDSDPAAPRLMMPSSRKGRRRRVTRKPIPITAALSKALRRSIGGRPPTSPLLVRLDDAAWRDQEHYIWFGRVAGALDLGPGVTFYALRHSSIVRQLLAGMPVRVVASNHDTSIMMIEHTYSRYIGEHSDDMVRAALLAVR